MSISKSRIVVGASYQPVLAEQGFGCEIEAEFRIVKRDMRICLYPSDKVWANKRDPSLRGYYSTEYVTKGVNTFGRVLSAIESLYHDFRSEGTTNLRLAETPRASTHFHIDVRGKSLLTFMNFFTIYYTAEEFLIKLICGEGRSGNLFCLSLKDAEHQYFFLERVAKEGSRAFLRTTETLNKYCALNLHAVSTLGSLEFRALKTFSNPDRALLILRILNHLICKAEDLSKKDVTPAQIISEFSRKGGGKEFCIDYLGFSEMDWQEYDSFRVEEYLRSGMRSIQPVMMGINWDE